MRWFSNRRPQIRAPRVASRVVAGALFTIASMVALQAQAQGPSINFPTATEISRLPDSAYVLGERPPGVPTYLTATGGIRQVMLQWGAPKSDGNSPITGYQYRQKTGDGRFGRWIEIPDSAPDGANAGSFTVVELADGTDYVYLVRARNALGPGSPSAEAAASTIADPPELPGAPTNLMATGGVTQVGLRWGAPESEGDSPITGYEYQKLYDGGEFGGWLTVPDSAPGGANAGAFTVTGLADNTRYVFRVRASNAHGAGPASDEAEASTAVAPLLSIAGVSAAEDSGEMTFPVTMDRASIVPVTVAWETVAGTATAGEDYEAANGVLTLAPGETGGTIRVRLLADALDENDENFEVSLSEPSNATLAAASATGVIGDDDAAAALSITDRSAAESSGEMVFTVTLAGATTLPVTVDWATMPGSATADQDYRSAVGQLAFAPGEMSRTLTVALLADELYEDAETFTVLLSQASNATLAAASATGVIENDDGAASIVEAWLARFGRTVAGHVVDAVDGRLRQSSGQEPGSHVTVGGYRLDLGGYPGAAAARDGWRGSGALAPSLGAGGIVGEGFGEIGPLSGWAWNEPLAGTSPGSGRQLWSNSSFHLSGSDSNGWGTGPGQWALWGRTAATRFDGQEGELALDGDVVTGTVGVDYARAKVLAGVALSYSDGDGEFAVSRAVEREGGDLKSSLTSVQPYFRLSVSEDVSVWGLLGYGRGDMELVVDQLDVDTDIEMSLGAVGIRGALLPAAEPGGFALAWKSDAFSMRMQSKEDVELPGAKVSANATRWRLALEGTRRRQLSGGGVFTPTVELGFRYDGGDAESGAGLELGGSLRYADASGKLTMELDTRALLAHEDDDYQEWGVGGTIYLAPDASGRGPSMRLRSTWGQTSSGVDSLWSQRGPALGPRGVGSDPLGRVEALFDYGLVAPGGRGLLAPYLGLGWSDAGTSTYRTGLRFRPFSASFAMDLEMARRESSVVDTDHGVIVRGEMRY